MRTAADVGESSLRRLLHYVSQLACESELALSVEYLNFGGKNAASHLGPCKPGDEAYLVLFVHLGIAELGDAEEAVHVRRSDLFLVLDAVLDDAAHYLAADVSDLAFKVADAGFAGVAANDFNN